MPKHSYRFVQIPQIFSLKLDVLITLYHYLDSVIYLKEEKKKKEKNTRPRKKVKAQEEKKKACYLICDLPRVSTMMPKNTGKDSPPPPYDGARARALLWCPIVGP